MRPRTAAVTLSRPDVRKSVYRRRQVPQLRLNSRLLLWRPYRHKWSRVGACGCVQRWHRNGSFATSMRSLFEPAGRARVAQLSPLTSPVLDGTARRFSALTPGHDSLMLLPRATANVCRAMRMWQDAFHLAFAHRHVPERIDFATLSRWHDRMSSAAGELELRLLRLGLMHAVARHARHVARPRAGCLSQRSSLRLWQCRTFRHLLAEIFIDMIGLNLFGSLGALAGTWPIRRPSPPQCARFLPVRVSRR